MKVGGESGGFLGRVKDSWQQAGEIMNQPSQADKEAAARQARTDELQAILEQQKPVELDPDQVARNLESLRRLGQRLTDAEMKQVSDFNNPAVRAAYEQWQLEAPKSKPEEKVAQAAEEPVPNNIAYLDDQRAKHNQDQEPAA